MIPPVVLDSAGLDGLLQRVPPLRLRAIMDEALLRARPVIVPAMVCAELCRGLGRTRMVEAALRRRGWPAARRPITVVTTDFALAKQVGAILHGAGAGSADIVDAHVVAACVPYGGGMIVTSDPDDISRLADVVPHVRIVTRRPD